MNEEINNSHFLMQTTYLSQGWIEKNIWNLKSISSNFNCPAE